MCSQIVVLDLADNVVLVGQVVFLDSQHVDSISALFFRLWFSVSCIVSNALRTMYVVYRRVIFSHRTLKRLWFGKVVDWKSIRHAELVNIAYTAL
jgi:hypothetical protein